ncbi:MAG: hypothetical protein HWD59_03710 [Coxiellaceae bacterium]|nr:MAG: hypothetical protein HWD59_03710 [Coxiellaceae bacterium]
MRQNNNFSTAAPKIETTLVDYQDEIQRLKIQLSQKELENTRLQQEVARLQKRTSHFAPANLTLTNKAN